MSQCVNCDKFKLFDVDQMQKHNKSQHKELREKCKTCFNVFSTRMIKDEHFLSCKAPPMAISHRSRFAFSDLPLGKSLGVEWRKIKSPADALKNLELMEIYPLHNVPGILSVDTYQDLIATGGADTFAIVFDSDLGHVVNKLPSHSSKVTNVKFVAEDNQIVTGCGDTLFLWRKNNKGNFVTKHMWNDHSSKVLDVAVHPTNNYALSVAKDNSWCFYDIASGIRLAQVEDSKHNKGFTCAAIHPEGLVMGTGSSDSCVQLWDLKSQETVASCKEHVGAVSDISFSNNGLHIATSAENGVKLWDIRKMKSFVHYDEHSPTKSVDFDKSGNCLASGGANLRVHNISESEVECSSCIRNFPEFSETEITSIKFGNKYLAVGCKDEILRICSFN